MITRENRQIRLPLDDKYTIFAGKKGNHRISDFFRVHFIFYGICKRTGKAGYRFELRIGTKIWDRILIFKVTIEVS